jgi:hypothetical protein
VNAIKDEQLERVETFIQRYYDLEVIVSREACNHATKSSLMFSDILGNAIINYIGNKNADANTRMIKLSECFVSITKAYANGFILPGQDLVKKLDDTRKRNIELMKDLAICMANYTALQKEHERLVKMIDHNSASDNDGQIQQS